MILVQFLGGRPWATSFPRDHLWTLGKGVLYGHSERSSVLYGNHIYIVNLTNMILYKYIPPARIDVLQKHSIRFTQYGDFNDPFELNPNIDKLAEENEIRSRVSKNFAKLVEEEYSKHPLISAFISKDAFIKLALSQEESVKNEVIGIEPHIVKLLPGLLQKTANSMLGALSLSEASNHELMWSHYAEEHKGYVIGFDSLHPFFNQKKTDSDELRHLRKIEYRDAPPVINLMNTNGSELFFVKSSKWTYEAEWRMLLPLSDATKVIDRTPYAIHLFNFPVKAIKSIIFGARSSNETKSIIRSLLSKSEFSHIELFKAQLDSASYGISINNEKD